MIQWLRSNYIKIPVTVLGFFIIACSSQEYTTAKLAIQQSDWAKVEEWLPKAMSVEPDNPEIPIVYAIEVHARKGDWAKMQEMLQKAMSLDPNKKVEVRAVFLPVSEQELGPAGILAEMTGENLKAPTNQDLQRKMILTTRPDSDAESFKDLDADTILEITQDERNKFLS